MLPVTISAANAAPTTSRTFSRVLITGIAGSGGSYMAEHILAHHPGIEVHGFARWHSTTTLDNLRLVRDRVKLHEVDLTDYGAVLRALQDCQPDAIFHLASHANVRASFTTPQAVLSNNILGTGNLLEAIRHAGLDPLVQLCSTSEVYGQVDPSEVPIKETNPLRGQSLRRLESRPGSARLDLFRQLPDAHCAHADVLLHQPASHRPVRN